MSVENKSNNLISNSIDHYKLIDSGNGKKLELISGVRVDRPCPQAIWFPSIKKEEWSKATSICHRKNDGGGVWEHLTSPDDHLLFRYKIQNKELVCKIKFTTFGHCGVFFEQIAIWEHLFNYVKKQKEILGRPPKILNLFAYTGSASVVMALAGAHVDHVDSAKGVLAWGKENQELSKVAPNSIRWIQEDAFKFIMSSKRRNSEYDGILADPPSWGHGVKKEVWDFSDQIQEFVSICSDILSAKKCFFMLTSHTHGIQHECLRNLLINNKKFQTTEAGELGIKHETGTRILPAGIYALGHSL